MKTNVNFALDNNFKNKFAINGRISCASKLRKETDG